MARLRFLAHAAAAVTVAAGLLTAVFAGTANACSCFPGDNESWRYARADHVFVAVVTAKRREVRVEDQFIYTVLVGREYKGDVPRRVEIATHVQGSACGIELKIGTRYLVFGKSDSTGGRVKSGLCDGTRLASGGPPTTTGMPTSTTVAAPTCSTSTALPS
ncbi:hypothetical protein [Actinosynnema sp. NPDC023587]|uniref:hypothetical protein n=1 Tax=Actinosynnema sp. NPDC023587 TaxID=3154695 RepID=UPI0033D616AF